MSIESEADARGLRAVGQVVARTLARLTPQVRAGVTTRELDDIALDEFRRQGARSGPRLDYGYPGTICISVNEEAVHGIPGPRVLREGDLVTLDVTAELDRYYADAAVTVAVPPASPVARRLITCAEAAFRAAVRHARDGVPIKRIGGLVEAEVWRRGFRVLRDLTGHGVGRRVHEPPSVPNYADPTARGTLTEGLVITLEPIVSVSSQDSRTLPDGWTIVSADGSLTAHHEHTLVVGRTKPVLLTAA